MKKTKHFGTRLVLYFAAVILVTLSIAIILVKNKAQVVLTESTHLTTEQTMATSLDEFDRYLKALSLPVDLNCRKNEFKKIDENYSEDSVKVIEDALLSALKVIPNSERAYYSTASGIYIQSILVVDPETGKKTGDYINETGVDHMNDVWFADCQGLKGRQTVFSNITKPYVNDMGTEVVTISQDLKAGDVHVGVVAMDINVSAFNDFFDSIGLMEEGFALLADSEGEIIFCNSKYKDMMGSSLSAYVDWKSLTSAAEAKAEALAEETGEEQVATVYADIQVGKESYHLYGGRDSISGWYMAGLISDRETTAAISSILSRSNIAVVISLTIGVISAILISKSISAALIRVNEASRKLAEGDLTGRLAAKRTDEFGEVERNFNTMNEELGSLISQVSDDSKTIMAVSDDVNAGADEIKTVTSEVTRAISVVASGATEQANATHEATEKVSELADNLTASTEKVDVISKHSKQTRDLSKKGNDILIELTKKSDVAKENARVSIDTMAEMLTALDKINFISEAIAEITSQTNLLSLNASIEAARAGEAGKGFAVVADEIRKLADQSNESTEEIKAILAEIQKSSSEVDASLRETGAIQDAQKETITETMDVFKEIAESISELEEKIDEIKTLNDDMNLIRADVISKMKEISEVSESSAASAEEVYASTEQVNNAMNKVTANADKLNEIVKTLDESVHKFKF